MYKCEEGINHARFDAAKEELTAQEASEVIDADSWDSNFEVSESRFPGIEDSSGSEGEEIGEAYTSTTQRS